MKSGQNWMSPLIAPFSAKFFLQQVFPDLLDIIDMERYGDPVLVFENELFGSLCSINCTSFEVDSYKKPSAKTGKMMGFPFLCSGLFYPHCDMYTLVGVIDRADPDKFAYLQVEISR